METFPEEQDGIPTIRVVLAAIVEVEDSFTELNCLKLIKLVGLKEMSCLQRLQEKAFPYASPLSTLLSVHCFHTVFTSVKACVFTFI